MAVDANGNKVRGIKFLAVLGGLGFALLIGVIFLFMFCFTDVEDGYRGVVKGLDGAENESVNQGIVFHAPYKKIIQYPVKQTTVNYKDFSVSTKDGKNMAISIDMNYHFKSESVVSIYRNYGNKPVNELEQTNLRTEIYDNVRNVFSKYTLMQVYGEEMSLVQKDIQNSAKQKLDGKGIVIDLIVAQTHDADKETQRAITERLNASQELEAEKIKLETSKQRTKRKVIDAKADEKALKERGEFMTKVNVQEKLIDKWDGSTPITVGGDSIIDLGSLGK